MFHHFSALHDTGISCSPDGLLSTLERLTRVEIIDATCGVGYVPRRLRWEKENPPEHLGFLLWQEFDALPRCQGALRAYAYHELFPSTHVDPRLMRLFLAWRVVFEALEPNESYEEQALHESLVRQLAFVMVWDSLGSLDRKAWQHLTVLASTPGFHQKTLAGISPRSRLSPPFACTLRPLSEDSAPPLPQEMIEALRLWRTSQEEARGGLVAQISSSAYDRPLI